VRTRPDQHDDPGTDDPATLQARWRPVWERLDPFRAGSGPAGAPRRYVLDMFPYPSGDLHMGHAEAFVLGDVVARYHWPRGDDVLHPIGWDSFGLPAENAALRRDAHPADWTYANIETQAESFRRYGIAVDWSRRLHTSDPEYYRCTQWLFLRLFDRGLAYRKASPVNWCPRDQTVLANEQVVDGACERCGTPVTKRDLTQWYFRITDYADRLLADMDQLQGAWPDRGLTMQRNWIGRSTGAHVRFARTAWPVADPALLVEESVTCVVQVAGKVRARLDVTPDVAEEDLRRQALAHPGVRTALGDRDLRTVIVRAPRLVNVVPT
jgi:leucyl-tRNA synthetase